MPYWQGNSEPEKYPNIVELAVPSDGLEIELSRRIIEFHKSRHIQPQHGRWITKEKQTYCRWCFADLGTACDFIEQFGGGYLGKPRQIKQKKLGK